MGFMDKAKDMAGQHPDQARQGVDKVEDAIDAKTGGQHADKVDKAGDMAEKQLGINQPAGGEAPAEPGAGEPPVEPPA